MRKPIHPIFLLIGTVSVVLLINFLGTRFHGRIDLTEEKRYTLSPGTKDLLKRLPGEIKIIVFLEGDLPAAFRRLASSTQEMLDEFQQYSASPLQVSFEKIGAGLEGESKNAYLDSMARLGLKPYTLQIKAKKEESIENRVIVPGAVVAYRGAVRGINLLSGQGSTTLDEQALNSSEALLEYHFAQAIHQLIDTAPPQIGYLLGNGESLNDNIFHLSALLRSHFRVSPVFIDSVRAIPSALKVLLMMKPQLSFTNSQKLKIDQYVMQGGKVLWLLDQLYAEMDSLLRSRSDFIAYDRNLNLDDLLFRYGIRINPDLIQDLQCDQIPLVVGNMGEQPQMQLVDWPYFPLLDPSATHPIAKNLNKVLSQFPNSIDTVSTPLLRKTVLLSSSRHTRILSTPALVSFASVETEEDLKSFQRSSVPVAVLVEGEFESLFRNRLTASQTDSLLQQTGHSFQSQSVPTQMIVVSDGDIATNSFSREGQPLEMGMNPFTRVQYANKDFLLNCLDYLVDPKGIFQARAKEVTLRLLDPESVEQYSLLAQLATLGGPLLVLLIVGLIIEAIRKKAFAVRVWRKQE